MNILIVVNARIPTEKAHGLQIVKMCEAFSRLGHQVELIVPKRRNVHTQSVFAFYNVKEVFRITYLKIVELASFKYTMIFRIAAVSYLVSLFIYVRKKDVDAIITRDILVAYLLCRKYKVFYEMHDFPERYPRLWRYLLSKPSGIIVTNQWKREEVIKKFGISGSKLLCAPNGFDPALFHKESTQNNSIRKELGFKESDFVLGYAGMLKTMGMDKGIGLLLDAMTHLPVDVFLLLVGGSETDIAEYRTLANQRGIEGRVVFKGRVKHREVPLYLSLCDVLVAPFPDAPHYRFYMSPIKLFEYMAAGRPIIATALPSIEEIIADAGILIQPDDAQAICDAVKRYRHDPEVRRQYSSRALARSKQYTWDNRAQRIEVFLKERIR